MFENDIILKFEEAFGSKEVDEFVNKLDNLVKETIEKLKKDKSEVEAFEMMEYIMSIKINKIMKVLDKINPKWRKIRELENAVYEAREATQRYIEELNKLEDK